MSSLAVCMIVKNEEKLLKACVESIKEIADEIIITDTGSTDKTVEIARQLTDKVYYFKWIDDFAAASNYSHNKSTSEYNCRWDADFLLHNESLPYLIELKRNNFNNDDILFFSWNVEFGMNNLPIKTLPQWFIFKRDVFHFESKIHVRIVTNDKDYKPINNFYTHIQVDHLKKPDEKKKRYSQTSRILKNALLETPNNTEFIFNYAEGLIFEEKFKTASKYLEKFLSLEDKDHEKIILGIENLMLCLFKMRQFKKIDRFVESYKNKYINHPRFKLLYADVTVIKDINKARKLYMQYMTKPLKQSNTIYVYDHERHYIHPKIMLAQIYLRDKNIGEAKKLLEDVSKETRLERTFNKVLSTLSRFS